MELLEYALDEGLSLGVHYCSLENKNRGQVFRQNAEVPLDPMLYKLDEEDFFYKTLKVFDGDVAVVRERFERSAHRSPSTPATAACNAIRIGSRTWLTWTCCRRCRTTWWSEPLAGARFANSSLRRRDEELQ